MATGLRLTRIPPSSFWLERIQPPPRSVVVRATAPGSPWYTPAQGLLSPRSQGKRSALGRLCSPHGPRTQVVAPLVKAVQLSALRHTSSPFLVGWTVLPVLG